MTTQTTNNALKTTLTYEDKVIQKIIGHSLESINGLLAISGGFFTDLKNKTINSDNVTDGINVEVGTKEVAVDLKIVVEYQKDIPAIAEQIKTQVAKEVEKMTHLKVVEINVHVVDVKTKAQHEADSVTLQDRLSDAAHSAGEFASKQAENAKEAIGSGVESVKEAAKNSGDYVGEKAEEAKEAISEATEPRVK